MKQSYIIVSLMMMFLVGCETRKTIDNEHPVSKVNAVLETSDEAAYLYLMNNETHTKITGVIVYNLIEPIEEDDLANYFGKQAPISKTYASRRAVMKKINTSNYDMIWSSDGSAVAIVTETEPLALILVDKEKGYSKAIGKSGPWGYPWNQPLFDSLFQLKL